MLPPAIRTLRVVKTVLALALLSVSACRGSAASELPAAAPEPVAEPAEGTNASSSATSCGVCFAHSYQSRGARGYGTDASATSLERLDDIGIRAVSLTPFGYQNARGGISIRSSERFPGGENSEVMRTDITRCREQGMTVMIKPHLWITGAWRGEIIPDPALGGWEAWFVSYTEFILEWARFAETSAADWFVVGVELKTSSTQTELWRALIAAVREVYSGRITYAANWDEVGQIDFWSDLDAVGVQMFAPLAEEGEAPTEQSARDAAARWLEEYRVISAAAERPLILTEAGVINRANSLVRPYEWPTNAGEESTPTGELHQRWAYEAIIETFGQADDVIGIYWWKVFTDLETREEGAVGFSPLDKPAEEVLRDACRTN